MPILEIKNLTKKFGDFVAVDNVNLRLAEGEIVGLLGPNGAGKTTTIQMMLGVLTPTAGEIYYFGRDFRRHRESILEQVNFSSTYTNLPWELTVQENLNYLSLLYDIPDRKGRVEKIIGLFDLSGLVKKKMHQLSSGQLTRVNLAKAFLNFPKVLLLDEPTASLDPDVAKYIRKFLLEERERFNVSIILTSHNMAEVEETCDRVVFIRRGKIVADDTPENLARTISISHLRLLVARNSDSLIKLCGERKINCQKKGKYYLMDINETDIPAFLGEVSRRGISYNEISIDKPSLEDYFLLTARVKEK